MVSRSGWRTRAALGWAVLMAGSAVLPNVALSAPLQLSTAPYKYTVIDQDLVVALQEFGSNMSIRMNISPEVRGRLQGPFPEMSAREFFERILRLNNLEAYFDGTILHVTSAKEVQSRLLVLGPVPFRRFERVLDAFQITDAQYKIRRAPEAEVALASGPPRFVALVEQTLTGLVAEEQARPKPGQEPAIPTTVTVFRGSATTVLRNGRVVHQYPEPQRAPEEAPPAAGSGQKPAGDGTPR